MGTTGEGRARPPFVRKGGNMRSKVVAFGSTSLLLATAAFADVTKSGPEFQVNAVTAGYQRQSDVAATAAGEFVVVWVGPYSEESDPEVRGRLIGASGLPEGDEFLDRHAVQRRRRRAHGRRLHDTRPTSEHAWSRRATRWQCCAPRSALRRARCASATSTTPER
jgi:hypothetical protein